MLTPGIHLVHKPVGPTSFDALEQFRTAHPISTDRRPPRMCHGGVLDPFASGLLLILVEPATKLFEYLHDAPKVYEATIRWETETDTGDPHGKVVSTGDASHLSPGLLEQSVQSFIGWHEQIPPATSNKRIGGERAYERAHRGETVDLPPSRVYLHEAIWLDHDLPRSSHLRLTVRGGFYVRSFVRDLGRKLGCGAHLAALHRSGIGPWLDPAQDQSIALTGRDILPWTPVRELTDHEVGELRNDRPIPVGPPLPADWPLPPGFPDPPPIVRGFHRDRFRFLLRPSEDRLHLITPLRGGL